MRNWSLSRRLVFQLTLGLGLLWLGAVGISTIVLWHEIDEALDSALQETAQRLLPLILYDIDEHEELDGERTLGADTEDHHEYILYQVRDGRGRLIMRSHDAPAEIFQVPLVPGFATLDGRRFYTEMSAESGIAVQVTEKPGHRVETLVNSMIGMIVPIILLLPLAGITIYWTVRHVMQPIGSVREAIRARSGTDLSHIDAAELPSELAPIIQDVNRLLERLELALAGERAFAANSAHELRTPVAAALAQLQRLSAELGPSSHQARVDVILASLRRLGNLVEKMLQLARAESGIAITGEAVDLLPVVTLVVEEVARRAGAHRLDFTRPESQVWERRIDIDAFAIVLRNLLDNALSHGDPAQPVEIHFDAAGGLHIVNAGPVIAAERLAHLKERFARGQTKAEGSGLGLAIADTILTQAGGTLELLSPASGRDDGFEAIVTLP